MVALRRGHCHERLDLEQLRSGPCHRLVGVGDGDGHLGLALCEFDGNVFELLLLLVLVRFLFKTLITLKNNRLEIVKA